MSVFRAVVRNGHIELHEPTDLPEGEEIELRYDDPYAHLDGQIEIDPAERKRLNAAIRKGMAEIDAGMGIDAEDFIKELDAL